MKIATAALALLVLAGCQSTLWVQPPLPETGCDSKVKGRWLWATEGSDEGIRLIIDGRCLVVVEKLKAGELVARTEPTQARMGRVGDQAFAWVDANTLLALTDATHRTAATDVIVFTYRFERRQLAIGRANHYHVSSLIEAGEVPGEVIRVSGEEEFNRITAPVPPQSLVGLFEHDIYMFSREGRN